MGDSTADGIHGSAGAVTALAELVDHEVGDAPFVVVAQHPTRDAEVVGHRQRREHALATRHLGDARIEA